MKPGTVKTEILAIMIAPLTVPVSAYFFSEEFNPEILFVILIAAYFGMIVIGIPMLKILSHKNKMTGLWLGVGGLLGGAFLALCTSLIVLLISTENIIEAVSLIFPDFVLAVIGIGAVCGILVGGTFGVIRHVKNERTAS
jgi:hypothetical protein